MSSPRAVEPSDGLVQSRPRRIGPMKMPAEDADAFVEEFNRTYRALGMRAIRRPDSRFDVVDSSGG